MQKRTMSVILTILFLFSMPVLGAPDRAPDRERGEGPFKRLILRGVIVVNGEGPPIGPMDVVIEGNRIASIHNVGFPGVPIEDDVRPQAQSHIGISLTKKHSPNSFAKLEQYLFQICH